MMLKHVKDNREFRGYITANDGHGEDEVLVEFQLDAEDKVTAVGFNWEPMLGSKYLFWHERMPFGCKTDSWMKGKQGIK
jgi:hypothetical protein